MGNITLTIDEDQFKQLLNDVAMIKEFLLVPKKELEKMRKISDSELISHEDVEKEILHRSNNEF